jgi:hypothetical protein
MNKQNVSGKPADCILSFAVFSLLLILTSCGPSVHDYYQIRIFTLSDSLQEARMDQYLAAAYLPALHRAGIEKAGVFKPIEEDTAAGNIIIVWIPFRSLEQFEELPERLNNDEEYLAAGKDYLEAKFDSPPFTRIESILLKAFRNMPQFAVPALSSPPEERIYELRSYESATGKLFERKVEMFNEGGEMDLFKKLDFNVVFYGEVISGSSMPNLMYMPAFSDMAAREEHWDAFRSHPDWKTLSGIKVYENTVSHITTYLLHPADYSDI